LQHALAEAEDDYRSILQAKEQTLRNANVATRARSVMRGDRDIAEKARDLYESFWTAPARTPRTRRASATRPPASATRHARRTSRRSRTAMTRAQAVKDRDDARAVRIRAKHDHDAARAARDRNTAAPPADRSRCRAAARGAVRDGGRRWHRLRRGARSHRAGRSDGERRRSPSLTEHQRAPASTSIRRAHGRDRRCSGAVLDQQHRHDLPNQLLIEQGASVLVIIAAASPPSTSPQ
jgi:hypothetical protein